MHRHQYKGRKLGREAGPRKALVRSLVSQIILHERITTTVEKAKEAQPVLEKLITRAKRGTLADRREAAKILSANDKSLVKLFEELGPLYKERNGGYTRIIKTGTRSGDNARTAIIELLDTEKLTKKAIEEKKAPKPSPKKDIKKPESSKKETKKKPAEKTVNSKGKK